MHETLDSAEDQATPTNETQSPHRGRRLFAALLSAIVPGTGQLLLRQFRLSAILLCLEAFWVAGFLVLRLPSHWSGWSELCVMQLALTLAATVLALLVKSKKAVRASVIWLLLFVPLAILAALFEQERMLIPAGFKIYLIPSSAMANTIPPGSVGMVDLRAYRHHAPSLGDIVVLRRVNENNVQVIKRVMAAPGDTIRSANDKIYVNGRLLNEPYAFFRYNTYEFPKMSTFGPITMPPHEYFVMGDNRDLSLDSRLSRFGIVDRKNILGQFLYLIPGLKETPHK